MIPCRFGSNLRIVYFEGSQCNVPICKRHKKRPRTCSLPPESTLFQAYRRRHQNRDGYFGLDFAGSSVQSAQFGGLLPASHHNRLLKCKFNFNIKPTALQCFVQHKLRILARFHIHIQHPTACIPIKNALIHMSKQTV